VKTIAQGKIFEIEQKIAELQSLKATLGTLVNHCHGNNKPDCPILDGLSDKTMNWSAEESGKQHCCEN
jgi:hypothetical protein